MCVCVCVCVCGVFDGGHALTLRRCVCRAGCRGMVQAAVRGVPGQPSQRHQPGRAGPVSSGGAAGAER